MNLLIHELFYAACRRAQDKNAARLRTGSGWETFTYGQLQTLSLKITGFLLAEGIAKGEKCALALENRPEWPAIYLGIAAAGATCVPLDTALSKQELLAFCADSGAKFVFCSAATYRDKIGRDFPATPVVLDNTEPGEQRIDFSAILTRDYAGYAFPTVSPYDIASLVYTSGTTGKPKGVLLSHKNLCSNALSLARSGLCKPDDTVLAILPLYHSYPFMATLLLPLISGACVIYSALGLAPRDLATVTREARVTIVVGVPQLFALMRARLRERINLPAPLLWLAVLPARAWLRRQFGSTLRVFASGGARLDPAVGRELSRFFGVKVIEGYGLTETSPVDTLNPPRKIKFGSAGKPLPDVRIKIVAPNPSGEGEIALRGPNVMHGYYRDPEETRRVIRDGWFLSGDLGYLDREGYLFITGRKKEVIVIGSGATIYPEELEERYSRGPYIKEVFIYAETEERFGVPTETLHAVVLPAFDYLRRKNEANIREKVSWELQNTAVSLPPYKRIMGFSITKENLPRTALGKIKRQEARERFVKRAPETAAPAVETLSEADQALLTTAPARETLRRLAGLTKRNISLYSNLELDLGLDSLGKVQFELELEEIFSIKIPDGALDGAYTVKDVLARMAGLSGQTAQTTPRLREKTWAELLAESPSPAMLAKVRTEPAFSDKLLTFFFLFVFRCLFKLCWFLRVRGQSPLPASGPLLICANHASYLDGIALFCALPSRMTLNTYFVGFSAIIESPLIRWAMKPGRMLPISPDTNSVESMKLIAFLLRHGKTVCVFPEGQRSADGTVFVFKKGVGIMAREMECDCLPAFIRGSYRAWPRQKRLPRLFTPIAVNFGRRISYAELRATAPETGDSYAAIAEALRQAVIKTDT